MFRDRAEAGRTLAFQLSKYKNNPNVVVLALPRGGVPVAFEVASELNADDFRWMAHCKNDRLRKGNE